MDNNTLVVLETTPAYSKEKNDIKSDLGLAGDHFNVIIVVNRSSL
jgi:hypothetical protein